MLCINTSRCRSVVQSIHTRYVNCPNRFPGPGLFEPQCDLRACMYLLPTRVILIQCIGTPLLLQRGGMCLEYAVTLFTYLKCPLCHLSFLVTSLHFLASILIQEPPKTIS